MSEIKCYISEAEIGAKVHAMAKEISADYAEIPVLLVCVLKGAVVFFADLMRALTIDPEIDFLQVSSYGMGKESSGLLTFQKEISADITGRHILLVEDIIDTGFTLYHLRQYLLDKGAASCKICAFLDKSCRRKMPIEADYVGMVVEDDGVGFEVDEKTLDQSVGMKNVRRRMAQFEGCEIQIESQIQVGTKVTLFYPKDL